MNTIDNILAEPEHVDGGTIVELIQRYKINAGDKFAEKRYLLERDGVGFAPRGNVCAVAAEKKAGKTWFCMAMAAAATSGEFLGMIAREENLKVLYFDTEQDAGDGQRIQRRVHFANGWDFETDNDRFQIFHLREVSANERREFVKAAIEHLKPDFVVVDGIRDLLSDFNDLKESADVIQEHMELSSKMDCVIWDVLHVNPNSEKMRGHLGTELGNKVADIIYLTKKTNPNDEDDVTYKAEETDARSHRNIHSITFRINDSKVFGMPELLDQAEVEQLNADAELAKLTEIDNVIKKYLQPPVSMSWTALRDAVRKGEHIAQTKAGEFVNQAETLGIVTRAINKKLVYVGITADVAKTENIPFELPDENKPPY